MTPLIPEGNKSYNAPALPKAIPTTSTQNALPRIPVVPQASIVTPPPLTKVTKQTKSTSKEIIEAAKTAVEASVEGVNPFTPPLLEKVSKSPKNASKSVSGEIVTPSSLRASWPKEDPINAITKTPPALELVKSSSEDTKYMYVITCRATTQDSPKISYGTVFGIYTYEDVVKLEGANIRDKLINLVVSNMSKLAPPLVLVGLGTGTVGMDVIYPQTMDIDQGKTLATIMLKNKVNNNEVMRTYTITSMIPGQIDTLIL